MLVKYYRRQASNVDMICILTIILISINLLLIHLEKNGPSVLVNHSHCVVSSQ